MAGKKKSSMAGFIKNIREGMFALSDVTKMDGAGMAKDKATKRVKGMIKKRKKK